MSLLFVACNIWSIRKQSCFARSSWDFTYHFVLRESAEECKGWDTGGIYTENGAAFVDVFWVSLYICEQKELDLYNTTDNCSISLIVPCVFF